MARQITVNSKPYIVQATHILGTRSTILSVYELDNPTNRNPFHGHSSLTTFDGIWYGKVSTRELPEALNNLPAMTDERYQAVKNFYREACLECEMVIHTALGETEHWGLSADEFGEIEVVGVSVEAARNYAELCNQRDTF